MIVIMNWNGISHDDDDDDDDNDDDDDDENIKISFFSNAQVFQHAGELFWCNPTSS